MKKSLHNELSFKDYVQVITRFLVSNYMNISKVCKNQGKRLYNLFLKNCYHNSVTFHDPDKVIFNFLCHVFNSTEKSLLSKGWNFAKTPKNRNYADCLII